MRVGLFRPVHVTTERSPEIRILLTACKFLQSTIISALRKFGWKVGAVTRPRVEARAMGLIKECSHLAMTSAPLLGGPARAS